MAWVPAGRPRGRIERILGGVEVGRQQIRMVDVGRNALAVVRPGTLFRFPHRPSFGRRVDNIHAEIKGPVFIIGIFPPQFSHVASVQVDQNANSNHYGHPNT